ncbi:Abi-alpha family protein [Mucilaginibacter agri]|uniref:DUF4393 domain-containing protein n=1 Tax=Mucilaginibacter agri TaxID=2695265 RepID=A0A965ZG66_9SPHI|nr:hypothetical protein [Mucilaginibacter agri]NCD69404.1 hypothetical protein [Mucilaginibacter agri]
MSDLPSLKKIDITSTVLEKAFDAARSLLSKLISPAVEEAGLLIKDQMSFFKFKGQIKMLNKAKKIIEENGINPKHISLKLLCPMLDYSGIEEDEVLEEKWSILLSNMVDSEQNIENHVFPYILSQLSRTEFLILESVFDTKTQNVIRLTNELNYYRTNKLTIEADLQKTISALKAKLLDNPVSNISQLEKTKARYSTKLSPESLSAYKKYDDLKRELRHNEHELTMLQFKESTLERNIKAAQEIPTNSIKDFELSNLIRLGVVKEIREFYAESQTLEIPNDSEKDRAYLTVDLDVGIDSNTENVLTELGELFINACKEKKNQITKQSN